jgi:hypothetical protein
VIHHLWRKLICSPAFCWSNVERLPFACTAEQRCDLNEMFRRHSTPSGDSVTKAALAKQSMTQRQRKYLSQRVESSACGVANRIKILFVGLFDLQVHLHAMIKSGIDPKRRKMRESELLFLDAANCLHDLISSRQN